MFFKHRLTDYELMDNLSLASDDLKKNLDELEMLNRLVGSKHLLLSALDEIHAKYRSHFANNKVVIGDLGCGGGDLLRAINHWAKAKNITVELIGFDANPFMIRYAHNKSADYDNIHYKIMDIFSAEFCQAKFDIVCMNSFCHHLENGILVNFIKQLTKQTSFAILINDLQRNFFSYVAIKGLGKLLNFSKLAQNDAPLSVLRAFHRKELVKLLSLAQINSYKIHWAWIFRWEVIIWCRRSYEN